MNKNLSLFIVAALCSLLTSPVLANAAGHADAPIARSDAAADVVAVTPRTTALLLTDDALDAVDAGGFGATTYGSASADRGHAVSLSVSHIVSSRMVTLSLSQSLALAIGLNPQTATAAFARTF